MKYQRWTAEADEAIKILTENGWTDIKIAHALGRTRAGVLNRRQQLGHMKVRGRPKAATVVKHYTNKPWWKKVLGV